MGSRSNKVEGALAPADWVAFLQAMGWPAARAARELGIGKNVPAAIEAGGGSLTVALACAALAAGLPPWSEDAAPDLARARRVLDAIDGNPNERK